MNIPIKYKKGDVIGNNGISFIKDTNLIKPRKALLKCHCGKEWETLLMNVKAGATKSCGCTQASKWAYKNLEEIKTSSRFRVCEKCKENKPIAKFQITKYKDRMYIGNNCTNCLYLNKVEKYGLETYTKTQRDKAINTLEGRANLMRYRARQRSANGKYEYSITKGKVLELLTPMTCAATGIPLVLKGLSMDPYAPSLDRIDSNKGYADDNIQVVCLIYNFCKNKFTEEQVKEFFTKIKNYGS